MRRWTLPNKNWYYWQSIPSASDRGRLEPALSAAEGMGPDSIGVNHLPQGAYCTTARVIPNRNPPAADEGDPDDIGVRRENRDSSVAPFPRNDIF